MRPLISSKVNEPEPSPPASAHIRWPVPIFDHIEDRVRVGVIVWITLWFGTTIILVRLSKENWAMPLMIVGIVGMFTLTRTTKFLQSRILDKSLRSNDQLCTNCGYDLTTENLRCPECGNVYTLADTRSAWKSVRDDPQRESNK